MVKKGYVTQPHDRLLGIRGFFVHLIKHCRLSTVRGGVATVIRAAVGCCVSFNEIFNNFSPNNTNLGAALTHVISRTNTKFEVS